jgi:hypothetical protein
VAAVLPALLAARGEIRRAASVSSSIQEGMAAARRTRKVAGRAAAALGAQTDQAKPAASAVGMSVPVVEAAAEATAPPDRWIRRHGGYRRRRA